MQFQIGTRAVYLPVMTLPFFHDGQQRSPRCSRRAYSAGWSWIGNCRSHVQSVL